MERATPVFTVKSVHDAIAWYQDVLEFQTVFRNEVPGNPDSLNYAVMYNGAASLHLGLETEMENVAGQGGCNFDTKDLDSTYRRAKGAAAEFYVELGTIPTGARTFGIKDPDGNLITFVEVD